jgi:phage tail sheath protein FI
MPVVPTYPGIYIDEILSSAHTISAAPTSLAVFIGYTHPFKTLQFVDPNVNITTPVRLFGTTDFEREFGGFFSNRAFDTSPEFSSVGIAVYQFFLNGGAECYVVGLRPRASSPPGPIQPQTVTVGGVTFAQIELTEDPDASGGGDHRMKIDVTNPRADPATALPAATLADVTVTYGAGPGALVERFRGVSLNPTLPNGKPNLNYIGTRIGLAPGVGSTLVDVNLPLPAAFTVGSAPMGSTPIGATVFFSASDYDDAMGNNTPLDKLAIFNLMNLPGVTNNGALSNAVAFCERKLAFLLIDPLQTSAADNQGGPGTTPIEDIVEGNSPQHPAPPLEKNAALYFPYLQGSDPVSGGTIEIPPGGTVAGIMSRIDLSRGVWKAPAGYETTIINTTGVVARGRMTNDQQGVLNQIGVNCLRDFPGVGTVVFGARTLVIGNPALAHDWGYVPVRRMALFLEQTLLANLGWVVFEPNDVPLWTSIRTSIEAFMLGLFRQHAFQGATPDEAFQVKCDSTTTTQADIDIGIVNIVVAFAPLRPAEFVIVKITQLAGQAQAAAA